MKKLIIMLVLVVPLVSMAKGSCPCPDNTDRRGSRCGKRSAFCRQGGDSPMCGAKSEKDRSALWQRLCN